MYVDMRNSLKTHKQLSRNKTYGLVSIT